jgi:hypothetical protein
MAVKTLSNCGFSFAGDAGGACAKARLLLLLLDPACCGCAAAWLLLLLQMSTATFSDKQFD